MDIRIHHCIDDIPAGAWDALHDGANPTVSHAFLAALERCGAVTPELGWHPHHLALLEDGRLAGAVPLYRKTNSWGEFVFDWSWAEAYHRSGLRYFPKLVAGVPYTPVAGPRLLAGSADDAPLRRARLARALVSELDRLGDSTLHVNFVQETDAEVLEESGLIPRRDVQFHWRNPGYGSFDDFLDQLSHKRRKNIRRERRALYRDGVDFEWVHGDEAGDMHWNTMHAFYADTFHRHLNRPVFQADAFRILGRALGRAVLLLLARRRGRYVAGAFCLRGRDTLFGRYWGCSEELRYLHFETCYYQGIEYCIREGLARFEPGAQGEFKLLRGFEPVFTHSFHWVRHPAFREAISRAVAEESELVHRHRDLLAPHAALKRDKAK